MLAFNRGPAVCDTGAGSGAQSGLLRFAPIAYVPTPPFRLAFDYILDVDSTGDLVRFFVEAPAMIQLFPVNLINDGALHSIEVDVPPVLASTAPALVRLGVSVEIDGLGDLGRGFFVDNVRFTTVNMGAIDCNGGSNAACPCSNGGGGLRGCANSTSVGAGLGSIGHASVGADTLQLVATNMPPSTSALWVQSSTSTSAVFGNGRICIGGTVTRLGRKSASASGAAVFPGPGDAPLSVGVAATPFSIRYYQVVYRDAAGFCGQAFNLTNGFQVAWTP
jgi:hypothetical protein